MPQLLPYECPFWKQKKCKFRQHKRVTHELNMFQDWSRQILHDITIWRQKRTSSRKGKRRDFRWFLDLDNNTSQWCFYFFVISSFATRAERFRGDFTTWCLINPCRSATTIMRHHLVALRRAKFIAKVLLLGREAKRFPSLFYDFSALEYFIKMAFHSWKTQRA